MDTSETYIKMCEKATEIQSLKPQPEDGNPYSPKEFDRDYVSFFYLPEEGRVEVLKWDNDEGRPIIGGYNDDRDGAIWLPRQDQLQEMVEVPESSITSRIEWLLIDLVSEYTTWDDSDQTVGMHIPVFKTFEQLWLAFVMKEKYGKDWNGEDWIATN